MKATKYRIVGGPEATDLRITRDGEPMLYVTALSFAASVDGVVAVTLTELAVLDVDVVVTELDHEHNEYGSAGCPSCRQREAERVSARFPAESWFGVLPPPE